MPGNKFILVGKPGLTGIGQANSRSKIKSGFLGFYNRNTYRTHECKGVSKLTGRIAVNRKIVIVLVVQDEIDAADIQSSDPGAVAAFGIDVVDEFTTQNCSRQFTTAIRKGCQSDLWAEFQTVSLILRVHKARR